VEQDLEKKVTLLEQRHAELTAGQNALQKHVDQLTADVSEIKSSLKVIATKNDVAALGAKVDANHSLMYTALRTVPQSTVFTIVISFIAIFMLTLGALLISH
jgi:phage shock protein A